MTCHEADALAAAVALGGTDADERRAFADHIASCEQPHTEARAMLGAGTILAASLEPVEPSPALRARVMGTVARTPQDAPRAVTPVPPRRPRARGGAWLSSPMPRWVGLAGIAATLLMAVLAAGLWARLADREVALRDVTEALAGGAAAYRIEGDVGVGYLVETDGVGATLVVAQIDAPPAEMLYELWLIGADGQPLPAGIVATGLDEVTLVPVELDLADFTTFAVTIERERVDAPTSDPVLTADLSG